MQTRTHSLFRALLCIATCLALAALPTQAASLVSWWKAEGDANDSVSSNNGVLQNGVTFAPGRIGQAFRFQGNQTFNATNSYVRIHETPSLQPGSGSFALLAWVMTTNGVSMNSVISQYENGGFQPGASLYLLSVIDGRLRGDLRATDAFQGPNSCKGDPSPDVHCGQKLIGTNWVADGQFHHIALVRDIEQQQFRLYVDGTLDAITNLNAGATGSIQDDDGEDDPVIIGGLENTFDDKVGLIFDGVIDEVQYWAGALSQQEILQASRAFWLDASLAGSYAALSIRGATGYTYRVEYVNALGGSNSWITATNFLMTSSPSTWTDIHTPDEANRFFRVVQLP